MLRMLHCIKQSIQEPVEQGLRINRQRKNLHRGSKEKKRRGSLTGVAPGKRSCAGGGEEWECWGHTVQGGE